MERRVIAGLDCCHRAAHRNFGFKNIARHAHVDESLGEHGRQQLQSDMHNVDISGTGAERPTA
eukprot:50438-Pyramimonas_sp.AAC.1